MSIDFEAEGLLDGAGDDRAREARLELLQTLEEEGFTLADLREATLEGRLALLPIEHVLAGEGDRYSLRDLADENGVDLDWLLRARRALGQPDAAPDERTLNDDDRELARNGKLLLDAGFSSDDVLELTRVMSQAMSSVAGSFARVWGEALLHPGDTERDLGLRYADSLQALGPLAGPTLQSMLNLRLREQIRQAVVGQAELASGHLPGSQPVVVAFVDIVGFTQLGEEIPPDQLGAVLDRFEHLVESTVTAPVRLVKTIGDAAMLVGPTAAPVLATAIDLVEHAPQNDERLALRAGVAGGEALPRAGDWYGQPVNLAARLTAFARRGSVVASKDVRDAAREDYAWSTIGRRRFRGVSGEIEVFRARPAEAD